jgi:hypothetical protein
LICEEGGPLGIIETMMAIKNTAKSDLLMAGMESLSNIANDPESAELIVMDGAIDLIVDVMQSHDWDDQLIDKTVRLLALLTDCETGRDTASQNNCMQVLLLAIKEHAKHEDFLHSAGKAMINLANDEENREIIRNSGGVDTILQLMEDCKGQGGENEVDLLNDCINILTRLSVDDELSATIATLGMHILAKVARVYFQHDNFLTHVFQLVAQLAFIPENLLCIVQHGGIELIFDAIEKHLTSEDLMVKCIETLDHISMADEEYAQIVAEAKGKEYVEEIVRMYADNEDVQEAGQACLTSMTAMASLASKVDIDDTELLVAEEPTDDPLKEFRSMLTSGSVLSMWEAGKKATRHVLVDWDAASILLKDTKKNTKKGVMMPLKSVKCIESGLGKGHKKRIMGKSAAADCAFNIIGQNGHVISLTCMTPSDTDRWVRGLEKLIDTFRNHRGRFVQG